MKPGQGLATLIFFTIVFAVAAKAQTPFWLKAWVVTKIDSPPADRTMFTRAIGMKIVMDTDKLTNPLGDDCMSELSYSDIQLRPIAEMDAHFGKFWKWPKFEKESITYGWIRCKNSNVGAFAFIASDQAYLFQEDGAVVLLK